MSKLDSELVSAAVDKILAFAKGVEVDGVKGKVRGFTETIELQVRPGRAPRTGRRAGRAATMLRAFPRGAQVGHARTSVRGG